MVDLATIDGVAFLNTSSIGQYPEMVRRRDKYAKRMGKWPATAYAILRTLRHEQPIDLVINGERHPGLDRVHRQRPVRAARPGAGVAGPAGRRRAGRAVPAGGQPVLPDPGDPVLDHRGGPASKVYG